MPARIKESMNPRGAASPTLLIACGALATEVQAVVGANGWDHIDVVCLPAKLHFQPGLIPEAMRAKIRANKEHYGRIFVLYGECGTAGKLDLVLEEEGGERIKGAHCYEFFAGFTDFSAFGKAELGTFYLTDFLARHFDKLVIESLGLDEHPELRDVYFHRYRKLVYLAQIEDRQLKEMAKAAAKRLGLEFAYHFTGLGGIEAFFNEQVNEGDVHG